MRFGLFCAPLANGKDRGPETGQGFHDWIDFNVEAEALGFHSSFLVEHHFTGWNQSSASLMMLAALAMRKRMFPGDHHEVAISLNNLAALYEAGQGVPTQLAQARQQCGFEVLPVGLARIRQREELVQ